MLPPQILSQFNSEEEICEKWSSFADVIAKINSVLLSDTWCTYIINTLCPGKK